MHCYKLLQLTMHASTLECQRVRYVAIKSTSACFAMFACSQLSDTDLPITVARSECLLIYLRVGELVSSCGVHGQSSQVH